MHIEIGEMRPVYDPAAELGIPCYVNDHCIIQDRVGLYHLFHIKGFSLEETSEGWNGMSELMFGHATSPDLEHWATQPQCIPALNAEKRVAAPNIVERAGTYYMFYNSAYPQTIRCATSQDLYVWHRRLDPVFVPPSWEKGGWNNGQGRDAFVLKMSDRWLLYYTTMYHEGGCYYSSIGVAESHDLCQWADRGPALIARERGPVSWSRAESPCVFVWNHSFWLLFTDRTLNQVVLTKSLDPLSFPEGELTSLGGFRASKIYYFDSSWYLTHCFLPLQEGNRGLYIGKIQFV